MPSTRTPTAPLPEGTDPNPTAVPPRPRAPIDAPAAANSASGTRRIGIGTVQSIVPETRIVRGTSGTGMRGMNTSARARTSIDGRARMSPGRDGGVTLTTSRRRKSMSTRYVVDRYLPRHDLTPCHRKPAWTMTLAGLLMPILPRQPMARSRLKRTRKGKSLHRRLWRGIQSTSAKHVSSMLSRRRVIVKYHSLTGRRDVCCFAHLVTYYDPPRLPRRHDRHAGFMACHFP